MNFDATKVRSALAAARAAKAENRDEYQNTIDLAYKQTLDFAWNIYEGKVIVYQEMLEGRFNEEEKDETFDSQPEKKSAPKRGRRK